jgi:hypothetical protein
MIDEYERLLAPSKGVSDDVNFKWRGGRDSALVRRA